MTDSVVVEGLVKIRDGKKWKSRWVVLRKPSPVADCLVVLVYKERGERASGQRERSSVTLEHIFGLEPGLPYEGLALGQSLTILCLSQSVALGFDCRETLQAWELRLRYSLGEVHRFGVGVLPGTKVETGPATLYLCNNLLVIARDLPPVIIGQWNLLDLRRYGPVTNGFVFEGGTRCGFWAGVFFLSCAEGEQISFLFDCIVRGISPSRGPFGLRPLLPDPNACPASVEERLNQEAQELEKRLSMLSHCSQHSTASTSSYSTSVAGDDRSISGSSDTSDTSQSDSSIGSRLAAWADPASGAGPAEAAGQSAGTRNAPLLADERQLPVTLVGGTRLPGVAVGGASAKPARSRRGLQEIGRQSSSDSGIATGSHSSYSGSFSSYTSSLDVGVGSGGNSGGDDFGSVLSLPPAPHPLATPAGAATTPAERTLCTCPPCPGHEYQVPSSLRYLYDTPRSLLLGTAKGEGTGGTSSATEPQAGTSSQAEASEESKAGKPGRLSRGNSSEEAPPSEEVAEVCQICTPRAIFTACPICGGLKGAPLPPPGAPAVPLVPDKKKQRCKADPSYEVMEHRTTERSSEVEEKSKYELMGSYGQQRLPHMDIEGGVFVFPADISMVAERPRVGDGVTYVNIPVSPTSKKQLNYMELELQETSASVRGRSSTKYAQIDITATETAHKVGTQHALGREEGLLKLEQKRRGGLPQ
ncbi:protein Dok-7-like isoform X4 [Alosa sapidissima]|uniref:protein Dok-7-like isoform X4 n=1 Tax=Alosa sapidissima TaxID=34773 RepID=UPI001C0A3E16|nr:protein Dok-7-like isoform X4 [Alosa sapidissima]